MTAAPRPVATRVGSPRSSAPRPDSALRPGTAQRIGAAGGHRDPGLRATGREPLWRELLGARLRRLRHERGERLGDIAERAGVSPQYLSEMERGVKDPSSEMIAAVAGALETSLIDLTLGVAEDLGARRPAGRSRDTVVRAAPFGLAA